MEGKFKLFDFNHLFVLSKKSPTFYQRWNAVSMSVIVKHCERQLAWETDALQ